MSPKLGGVEIITCWCVPVDSYFLVPDGQSLCEWPNCPHGAKDRPSAAVEDKP